ncbi:hypothetical protein E2C01_058673 [Portunus trituberculatus]|uniref:Uncharacterized protein n=1 Tax=Portunus trituberculatus TaxID=210409 RepID=A0A5B7H4S7_PORTR|nr:hypothetical protein [Portunus trituberculatus]
MAETERCREEGLSFFRGVWLRFKAPDDNKTLLFARRLARAVQLFVLSQTSSAPVPGVLCGSGGLCGVAGRGDGGWSLKAAEVRWRKPFA